MLVSTVALASENPKAKGTLIALITSGPMKGLWQSTIISVVDHPDDASLKVVTLDVKEDVDGQPVPAMQDPVTPARIAVPDGPVVRYLLSMLLKMGEGLEALKEEMVQDIADFLSGKKTFPPAS